MIAATPRMGWNSWDCFGTTVTEEEVLANARFMSQHMLHLGWNTVVVDIQWYDPTARAGGYNDEAPLHLDEFGRHLPAENRFPSAAGGGGFAALAHEVHALGLEFGVHIMRGIPRVAVERRLPVLGTEYTAADIADRESTCPWNADNYGIDHDHPAGQAYYDSQVALFTEWGVDFVKADDMLAPYHAREIEAYARAIAASGRDIALSLSPGTDLSLEHSAHLGENAEMWRVSNDLWDQWSDVVDQFTRMARWAPLQRPGAWADADMLPLGRIGIRAERGLERDSRLDLDEQRTLLTLWGISKSPLMMGGDLPSSSRETIELLTHDALVSVLRFSSGGREVLREGDLVIWTADGAGEGERVAAIFCTGEERADVEVPLSSLGVPSGGGVTVTDAWSGEQIVIDRHLHGDAVTVTVPRHGCRLVVFS